MGLDSVSDGLKLVYSVLAVVAMAGPALQAGPYQGVAYSGPVENALSIEPFRSEVALTKPAIAADTLYRQAVAGDVLITVLPDSVSTGRVTEFENLRVPTYSWRRGRAFFWQTAAGEAGVHVVQFLARTGGEADTLTLIIDIEPRERAR